MTVSFAGVRESHVHKQVAAVPATAQGAYPRIKFVQRRVVLIQLHHVAKHAAGVGETDVDTTGELELADRRITEAREAIASLVKPVVRKMLREHGAAGADIAAAEADIDAAATKPPPAPELPFGASVAEEDQDASVA